METPKYRAGPVESSVLALRDNSEFYNSDWTRTSCCLASGVHSDRQQSAYLFRLRHLLGTSSAAITLLTIMHRPSAYSVHPRAQFQTATDSISCNLRRSTLEQASSNTHWKVKLNNSGPCIKYCRTKHCIEKVSLSHEFYLLC